MRAGSASPRFALAAAVLGAATLVAASCSSSATAKKSSGPVPLVVYSAQGYDSAMTKAFQRETGIPVKLVDDSTGPLLTKIEAERNNPQWGLLWVDGDTAFAALDKKGQLLPYTPKVALNPAGKALIPTDHSFVPTGTTVMAALIYNAARSTAVPSSYDDLLGAAYRGKVGMNDPSQSGPTYPFIAGRMNQLGGPDHGVDAGERYFKALKANGLHVFPTNGDTLHALETGQIDYGLIQSSAAVGEVQKVKKTAAFDPRIVYLPKPTLLPSVIGIDKAASPAQQAEAERFIEYVLSPAGQKVMEGADPHGDSLYWPVVPGVQPLPALPALPSGYQRIDPYLWGPLEGQINSWFDANVR